MVVGSSAAAVSARPEALRRVGRVGAACDADLRRAGSRLGALRVPQGPAIGDALVALAVEWSGLEAWVARVGEAFERADAGGLPWLGRTLVGDGVGAGAGVGVATVPERALGAVGDGPTWVDALSDAQAESAALRLARELRPVAERITGPERAELRAQLWPLVQRLRVRWPAAVISSPSSSPACATPPPRKPDGLEDAIRLLHLAGPGRVPHTAGVAEAFGDGFLGGELSSSYDNVGGEVARTAGQVTSGVLVFGDVRDAVVEGSRDNWAGVALALGGLVPGLGDVAKGGKAIDDVVDARRVAIDLAEHDAWGGHGLLKHVGLDDAQLLRRLAKEPKIPAASTFADANTANRAASTVVQENATEINAWLKGPTSQLLLDRRFEGVVGRVIPRGGVVTDAHEVRLVIRRVEDSPTGWYIHTMRIEP